MIIPCNLWVFDARYFCSKSINAWILRDIVFIILRRQASIDQRNCNLLLYKTQRERTIYCTQWSRSAGLWRGPCLSMISIQAFCVRILMSLMSSDDFPIRFNWSWRIIAHSTAVCAWNLSLAVAIMESTRRGKKSWTKCSPWYNCHMVVETWMIPL